MGLRMWKDKGLQLLRRKTLTGYKIYGQFPRYGTLTWMIVLSCTGRVDLGYLGVCCPD